MKELFTFALTLSICAILTSQPVITRDDLIMNGDQYAYTDVAAIVDPGPDGANADWDFSSVMATNPIGYGVTTPGMTPYGGNFPGATSAIVSSGGALYQYQDISNGGWEDYGYVAIGMIAATLNYNNTRTYLKLPLEYTSQWTDDYDYHIEYSTNPVITTDGEGNVDATVDGYGTVHLPQGTFTDALRIRIYGSSTDTTDLGFGLYERNYFNDTTYLWWSPSYPAPLCTYVTSSLLRITTVIQGGDTSSFPEMENFTTFGFDPAAMAEPSATSQVYPGRYSVSVRPNPTSSSTVIDFVADENGKMKLELYNTTGQLVLMEEHSVSSGATRWQVITGSLSPGTYIGRLSSGGGSDIFKIVRIESQ